jgi:hypothetical protein
MDDRSPPAARRLRHWLSGADVACPRCRYNLRGTGGVVCPECGLALREEHFAPPPAPTRAYRAAQGGALMAAVLGVGHALIYAPRSAGVGDWRAVALMAAAAGAGLATAVVWTLSRRAILRRAGHVQARIATLAWAVTVLVLLVTVAT